MFEDYMGRSAKSFKRFRRASDTLEETDGNKASSSKEKASPKTKPVSQDKIKNDLYKNLEPPYFPPHECTTHGNC
ncbi:hypothetical protein BIW11_03768 [Tropilaelaps mercedesae]|uniref:Uncharacterized protein n=1 Tax=Tropilaelaps mercedesae TaxID=418985 RepID=A0A1V9XG23_9ACAR|nr:hypothetical protein BIW11_03768 [Tropilaelaps mercedesae]